MGSSRLTILSSIFTTIPISFYFLLRQRSSRLSIHTIPYLGGELLRLIMTLRLRPLFNLSFYTILQ